MNIKSFLNVLIATALAYFVVFVLMLIVNMISLGLTDPQKFLSLFAYSIFFIGALTAGFLCAKMFMRYDDSINGILPGAAAGIVYTIFIFLISLLFQGEKSFIFKMILNIVAILISSAGGFLGSYKKSKKISPKKNRDNIRKKYLNQL